MKLALMQPYLFPYLGYFQLISCCDIFVVYDDVQFIKGGWINRNRILVNGAPKFITLPLEKDHLSKIINERSFTAGIAAEKQAILRQLEAGYRKAPFFQETLDLAARCFDHQELNVAKFVTHALTLCCRHLQIETPIKVSSLLAKGADTKGEQRVIEITSLLGADHYINAHGGRELYSKEAFQNRGIALSFLKPREITYPQAGEPFVPWLSILDVLMFNSVSDTKGMLGLYDLE